MASCTWLLFLFAQMIFGIMMFFFSKCRVSVDFKNIIKYAKNSGKNERKKRSFFDRSQDMPENPIKIGTYPTNYYAR